MRHDLLLKQKAIDGLQAYVQQMQAKAESSESLKDENI
jgi:hypothetical protein